MKWQLGKKSLNKWITAKKFGEGTSNNQQKFMNLHYKDIGTQKHKVWTDHIFKNVSLFIKWSWMLSNNICFTQSITTTLHYKF